MKNSQSSWLCLVSVAVTVAVDSNSRVWPLGVTARSQRQLHIYVLCSPFSVRISMSIPSICVCVCVCPVCDHRHGTANKQRFGPKPTPTTLFKKNSHLTTYTCTQLSEYIIHRTWLQCWLWSEVENVMERGKKTRVKLTHSRTMDQLRVTVAWVVIVNQKRWIIVCFFLYNCIIFFHDIY